VIVDLRMPGEEHSGTGRGAPDTSHRPQSQQSPMPNAQFPMPPPLVEAQGWVIGPNGEVILTADPPAGTPSSPRLTPPECRSATRRAAGTQGRL
jgi:hypothetical protein